MIASAPSAPDVVVVGGGIIGLSTARELARSGARVMVIEQARPGAGQSSGDVRLLRHHHEHERLIGLCARARACWLGWEQEAGRRLLGHQGVLVAGDHVPQAAEQLSHAGVAVRRLQDGGTLLPLLAGDARHGDMLLDEHGGVIRAAQAVRWLAEDCGAYLLIARVLGIDEDAHDGVRVVTTEGTVSTGAVVACAGVDTRELAAATGVDLPIELRCHARMTFALGGEHSSGDADGEHAGEATALPAWIDRRGIGGTQVYGLPVPGERFAVGLGGVDSDVPVSRPAGTLANADVHHLQQAIGRVVGYVRQVLPGLRAEPVAARICISTLLPGGGDCFAAWPSDRGAVTWFAGNNVFKFAPLIGAGLAAAARGEELPWYLKPPEGGCA